MTHPAIDDYTVTKLKATLSGEPVPEPALRSTPSASAGADPSEGRWSVPAIKARARHAATPIIDKVRHELATAAEQEQAELRAEVAQLKELLLRTRAEHGAELAALHEELAASRRP